MVSANVSLTLPIWAASILKALRMLEAMSAVWSSPTPEALARSSMSGIAALICFGLKPDIAKNP